MTDPLTATQPLSAPEATREPALALALQPGDILAGHYTIERALGSGGMGRVYAAFDWALNRRVAIKVAHRPSGNAALAHEARVMATFCHPSVPMVYGVGAHQGHTFLVMEHIPGRSLAEHLRQGRRFGVAEVRCIMNAICENLQALHRAGVTHRDLKPANIMLTPDGRVVLIDFGLCIRKGQAPVATIAGSPHYMAPEVALERVQSGREYLIDVYALGVVGFVLLCGRKPFTGRNVLEVLDRQMDASAPSVRAFRPEVPAPLADLLAGLLAREPAQRPQSLDNVRERLARRPSRTRAALDRAGSPSRRPSKVAA